MGLEHKISTVDNLMESLLDKFITFVANGCVYEGTTNEFIVNWVLPLFPKVQAEASKQDKPNWNQTMNGPFAYEYQQAACNKLESIKGMGYWDVVDSENDMNVIRPTWDFKLKRYPDGIIKKFKSILCTHGYMQLGGIYFFDTYAPVFQWTTITVMLILEILLQLKPKKGDTTAAFLHAKLDDIEKYLLRCRNNFSDMTDVEIKGY